MTDQNQKKSDEQQKQRQKPDKQDGIRKAEIRKAVKEDMIDPNNPQGQQSTDYSGGS